MMVTRDWLLWIQTQLNLVMVSMVMVAHSNQFLVTIAAVVLLSNQMEGVMKL